MILKAMDVTTLNLEKCNLDNILDNLDSLRLGINIIKNDNELQDITYESIKIYYEEYHLRIIDTLKNCINNIKIEIDNAKKEIQNLLLSSKELDTSQIPELSRQIYKLKNIINFLSYFGEDGKLRRKYESRLKNYEDLKNKLIKVEGVNSKYNSIFSKVYEALNSIIKRISLLCSWIDTGKTIYDKDEYYLNFSNFNYELYLLYDEIINLPIDRKLKFDLVNNKLKIIQNMPFNIDSDEEIINKYIAVQIEYYEALECLGLKYAYGKGIKLENYEIPEEGLDGELTIDCSGYWHVLDKGMFGSDSSFKYPMHEGSRGGGTGSDLNIARQIEKDALIPILTKENVTIQDLEYIEDKYNYSFSKKNRKLLLNHQMKNEQLVECVDEIVNIPVDHVIKEGQEFKPGSTLVAKGSGNGKESYDHVSGILVTSENYTINESRSFTTKSGIFSGVGIREVDKNTLTYIDDPDTDLFNEKAKNRYVIEAPERFRCLYNHNKDTINEDIVR